MFKIFKKKNQEKQENVQQENKSTTTLNITRYTYDAWMKCFPESNEEEWKAATRPISLLDFISGAVKNMEERHGKKYDDLPVKVVTLDEEYFDWLGDRDNTTENRMEYSKNISDKEAVRLAKKNNLHYSYTVCIYPIPLSAEEVKRRDYRKLIKNTQAAFIDYIKQITPELDVYVLPYLMSLDTVKDAAVEDKLVEMAKTYFETGKDLEYKRWERVRRNKDTRVSLYALPIVFREIHNDTVTMIPCEMINNNIVLGRAPEEITMDDEFFEVYKIKDAIPLLSSLLLQDIKKDLGITVPSKACTTYFVKIWNIDEFCDEYLQEIKRTVISNEINNKE